METKRCSKCGEVKGVEEFYKCSAVKSGIASQCKKCQNEYYENNKHYITEYKRKYHENNKDRIALKKQEWGMRNKEYNKKHSKEWYEKNKENVLKYCKEKYKKNKDKILKLQKEYYKKSVIIINKHEYNINTAPDELKPIIQQAIDIKNLKKDLIKNRKKIEKGEI